MIWSCSVQLVDKFDKYAFSFLLFPPSPSPSPDHSDLKQVVLWVCDYIQHQAEKNHLQHSKDLHTSIVGAFSCLLSWITLHPYLLGDKVRGVWGEGGGGSVGVKSEG